jgi:hypothetical protein
VGKEQFSQGKPACAVTISNPGVLQLGHSVLFFQLDFA